MNPAQRVITRFGGQSALAKLLEKRQSTVQHWVKSERVPAKWQQPLLSLARDHGIDLTPDDFVMSPEALAIQEPHVPVARWPGELPIGEALLPVYVLDDGRRVISRTGTIGLLRDRNVGGNLESYLRVAAIKPYLCGDVTGHMINFSIPGVVNKTTKGLPADTFIEICQAFVKARNGGALKSENSSACPIDKKMPPVMRSQIAPKARPLHTHHRGHRGRKRLTPMKSTPPRAPN